MITDEMAARFHLPPIDEYGHGEAEWYRTFLIQSDYVALKAAEAVATGNQVGEDIADIIAARQYARQKINEIEEQDDGTTDT